MDSTGLCCKVSGRYYCMTVAETYFAVLFGVLNGCFSEFQRRPKLKSLSYETIVIAGNAVTLRNATCLAFVDHLLSTELIIGWYQKPLLDKLQNRCHNYAMFEHSLQFCKRIATKENSTYLFSAMALERVCHWIIFFLVLVAVSSHHGFKLNHLKGSFTILFVAATAFPLFTICSIRFRFATKISNLKSPISCPFLLNQRKRCFPLS